MGEAETAFKGWCKTGLEERAALVRRLADALEKSAKQSARTMTLEMGKTLLAGEAEIEKCVKYCRYTADKTSDYFADTIVDTEYKRSFTLPLPLGTILLVIAVELPILRSSSAWRLRQILAGNTCLLKHASNVPPPAP